MKAKFRVSGRTLFWEGGEEVPVLTDAQYWGEEGDPDALAAMKRFHVAKPYYSEFFPASRQSLVSYSFRAGKECPPTGRTRARLPARGRDSARGGAFRVVTYGDSIGQGMTSSKLMGIAPASSDLFGDVCGGTRKNLGRKCQSLQRLRGRHDERLGR